MFFVLGLFLGSFLNVVAERAARGERWFFSRSRCDSCKHKLSWYDLIPLVSWAVLRGRCRHCGNKISVRYPLSELAFGISLSLATVWYLTPMYMLYVVSGLGVLYLSVLTDIYDGTIHDSFTVPFALLFLAVGLVFFSFDFFLASLLGTVAGALFAFVFYRLRKMGQGDITLLAFAGSFLGFWGLIRAGVLTSFVAGIVIVFLLATKKTTLKGHLPLAPFLFAGAVLSFYL